MSTAVARVYAVASAILIGALAQAHVLAAVPQLAAMSAGDWDTYSDTWGGTDALGRTLPENREVGNPRAHKTLGIFCFLNNAVRVKLYDNTKLLAASSDKRAIGPAATIHWWGEPWFGYYDRRDPAVIRKQAQMLANAGVDVMIYDNTNGPTYPDVRESICKVLAEMRAEGLKTPQIAFFCGHNAWEEVYRDFYLQNKYPGLWFRWKGKPLMLVHLDGETLPPEISAYFTVRESWAWSSTAWFQNGHDKWPWLDNYPQKYGWDLNPAEREETSVCVAQHATTSIGRSFHDRAEPALDKLDSTAGLCFAEQWRQALSIDPQFVFVSSWNEWTAGCYVAKTAGRFAGHPQSAGDFIYVDDYDEEFSRDIEPENGALQDDYYYQLVAYARRYKGVRAVAPVEPQPIHMGRDFSDWTDVKPEFRDAVDDPVERNAAGRSGTYYTNQTGRNDFVAAKVSYDARNIYFYVRTKDAISRRTDPNWMLLYIDSDNNPKTGWLGYDYVVNRADVKEGTTTIQRNAGGKYEWKTVATIPYFVKGNEMEVAAPRALFGNGSLPAQLNFKWADNIRQTGEASDFTLNGDAAPDDRFYYIARFAPAR